MSSITAQDIEKASLLQRCAAFGIMYDKSRITQGLSTHYVPVIHADIAALQSRPIEQAPVDLPVQPERDGGQGPGEEGEC